MILKKEEWRAMAVCVGLGLYLSLMPHSVLGQDDLTVLLEVSPAQLSKGTPAMLRIVLRNRGPNTTHVSGRLGWGNGIEVLHANPDGAFRPLAPDVPHGDTDLGPIFTPLTISKEIFPLEGSILSCTSFRPIHSRQERTI